MFHRFGRASALPCLEQGVVPRRIKKAVLHYCTRGRQEYPWENSKSAWYDLNPADFWESPDHRIQSWQITMITMFAPGGMHIFLIIRSDELSTGPEKCLAGGSYPECMLRILDAAWDIFPLPWQR